MDFYKVITSDPDKKGEVKVTPDFRPRDFKDLMIRGGSFYAIWDETKQLWSTDEYDTVRFVDRDVIERSQHFELPPGAARYSVQRMESFSSNVWVNFKRFMKSVSDSYHELDSSITFQGQPVSKTDYVSKRVPYALEAGPRDAWDEILSTLYSEENRRKIEWAIGSIVAGDSKFIQKFLVFYGSPGTGKSTIMEIISQLFEGYSATFDARALGQSSNAFATAAFKTNPLVGIQHDGDLSRMEDNTKLNSIIAHEDIIINEKNIAAYSMRINTMLFMGTNQPVRITDAKSGILRRLIDVHPTGSLIPQRRYHELMDQVQYELGAIAQHCLQVYSQLGRGYYSAYRPTEMMAQTDFFYNFVMSQYDLFERQGGVTSEQAWALFKEFCAAERFESKMPKFKFREELKNYFKEYHQRRMVNGETMWGWYEKFDTTKFLEHRFQEKELEPIPITPDVMIFDKDKSIMDVLLSECYAQYGREDEFGNVVPKHKWANVETVLSDIKTDVLHYVKVPYNHIVIDFDLKGADGKKDLERNVKAAQKFPPTYGELSRGEGGIHLHYLYEGDVSKLERLFDEDIEVKVFTGGASLRRKLSKCNDIPIATIQESSGILPLKEEKQVLTMDSIQSERGLRRQLIRNLRKEIHPGTKPSIDFIQKILSDVYKSGMPYDVTDMKSDIMGFAMSSTHQPERCLEAVTRMHFKSDIPMEEVMTISPVDDDKRLVFFDVEVYKNLFVICWKFQDDDNIVRMVNPDAEAVSKLLKMRLVGFNNRRYDNHILYAAVLGYNNLALYNLSKSIIDNRPNASFGEAFNISYTDIYDYSSVKMGLKKFQIALGITHKEMDLSWDEPVTEDLWDRVVEYCCNDVVSTEAVHNSRMQDFVARKMLSELADMSPNTTTNQLSAKIIFGDDKRPQQEFVYTDLSGMFPGYTFELGKSNYRDFLAGEGGFVYAEPGIYENVALLDVASMHPTSIRELNLFGDGYTKKFYELVEARLAIKRGQHDKLKTIMGGKLAKYVENPTKESDKSLSDALKIVINSVYGLTSAKFENRFRDMRNKDNIVAKRGALFMIDLMYFVQERGFTVAHIKTDSIKIPNATPEIIAEVTEFGKKYGYDFEHEATYRKFALVNDAVYVAQKCGRFYEKGHESVLDHSQCEGQFDYEAKGAQFQQPIVFKTLFSGEEITYDDHCETKQVAKGAMYMDFDNTEKPEMLTDQLRFIGRTGRFVPVLPDRGGAGVYRYFEEKFYAVAGTKGHQWREADLNIPIEDIDAGYFQKLVDKGIETIEKFGSYEEFVAPF